MAWRYRKHAAPYFKQPTPYNPQTGQMAEIGRSGLVPIVALFQVIEEDSHENYVVCRGFDPESGRFLNSIPIAKQFGQRGTTGTYSVGNILQAARPLTRLGRNAGKSETSVDQPESLSEDIVLLTDDEDRPVDWIIIGGGGGGSTPETWLRLSANLHAFTSIAVSGAKGYLLTWNEGGYEDDTETGEVSVFDLLGNWGLGAATGGECIRVVSRSVGGSVYYEARSHGSQEHMVTLSGNLVYGGTCTATRVIDGATVTITVVDAFLDSTGIGSLPAGTIGVGVRYDPIARVWHAVNARCVSET